MSTVIRETTPRDLAEILEVFLTCWRESYRTFLGEETIAAMTNERAFEMWQGILANANENVYVAEIAEKIHGVTRFSYDVAADSKNALSSKSGTVHSLYVSPSAQGRGLGTLLLRNTQNLLEVYGASSILLWVFRNNSDSILFYRSCGWLPDGEERIQPEFGEPELRLSKQLKKHNA